MATNDVTRTLTDLLEPLAEAHGFELVAVEQSGGRRSPVIRVLLDRDGGLDLEAITVANGWVSDALDQVEQLGGPYTLEVSSPGVDRPLRRLVDFDRFAGETVTVKTHTTGEGRHAWTGKLLGAEDGTVLVEADREIVRIPFDDIVKARLKGVVSFNRERGAE